MNTFDEDENEPDCMCGDDDCPMCNKDCWQCHGEGAVVIGGDWDSDDPVNGPYPGQIQRCPCCCGTGKAKDCTYW